MKRYHVAHPAKMDLRTIRRCVARKGGLDRADSLLDQIEARFRTLAAHPSAGRARFELGTNLRGWPVESYLILYRASEAGIEIVRILHGRRDIRALFETS